MKWWRRVGRRSGTLPAWLLVHEIVPRLRTSIPGAVRCVGAEDQEELLQDGTAVAAKMLHSAEAAGKQFTPGNIAYYAVQHLRSGRRSTGFHKSDPLHPGAQMSGRSRMQSLDEVVSGEDSGDESLTLNDVLASRAEDPASEAGRRIDWQQLIAKLDKVACAVLQSLADGQELTKLVPRLGLSRSTLQNQKMRLAGLIREFLGQDVLVMAQQRPAWLNNIAAARQKSNCRWERQAA